MNVDLDKKFRFGNQVGNEIRLRLEEQMGRFLDFLRDQDQEY